MVGTFLHSMHCCESCCRWCHSEGESLGMGGEKILGRKGSPQFLFALDALLREVLQVVLGAGELLVAQI